MDSVLTAASACSLKKRRSRIRVWLMRNMQRSMRILAIRAACVKLPLRMLPVRRKMIMVAEKGRSHAVFQRAGAWIVDRLSMISIRRFIMNQAVRSTRTNVMSPDCQEKNPQWKNVWQTKKAQARITIR